MEIEVQYEKAPVKGCTIKLSKEEINELKAIFSLAEHGISRSYRNFCINSDNNNVSILTKFKKIFFDKGL